MKYGICDCGKWGKAPNEFRETKHFMICECGKPMYLHINFNAKEYGFRESDEIIISKLILHGEK